jgi:glycosyltransferase involved in cell wall biosynthesis
VRIVFVLPAYPRSASGGYKIVYEHGNRLAARGHVVHMVHTRERARPGRRSGPPVRQVAQQARFIAGRARDMIWSRRIRQIDWHEIDPRIRMHYVSDLSASHIPDADVVVATAWWTAIYVNSYPSAKGKKHYFIQNYEIFDGPSPMVDATWRFPIKKAVISSWLADKAKELGVPASEVTYVPYGFDHQKYSIIEPLASRPRRVVMLYHAAPWKKCLAGIEALELAHEFNQETQAVLFGTFTRPRQLPSWIAYERSPSQNQLVRDIYNRASVYLCPSEFEGWHLPPAEAVACGCTIVSTDIGGVRDYAIDGQTALLAALGDTLGLATCVTALLDNNQLRLSLGNACREVLQKHTWESASRQFEEWLLDG